MKNLFKMTIAALALVAFASCSNEELFGNKTDIVTGDPLNIVSIEEPLAEGVAAGTRSSMDKDNNSNVVWDAKDVINVYDDQLYMSDAYTYDATTNRFLGTAKNVSEPKFGIYPKASIYGTSNLDEKLILRMDLPSTIKYTTETETTIDGKTVYASNLPLWSPASKDADGVQMEKLRYLTAVLKVWLPNAPGNINYMVIKSKSHNLSGAFTAVLDTENADAVQLQEKQKGDAQQDYIFVDLTKVPSNMSVVYLPIIAGTYAANDLAIYANKVTTKLTENDAKGDPTAAAFTANWQAIREFTTGVTLKRAGFYNVKVSESDYPQKAENPAQISHLLDLYKTNDVLNIETKNFTVNNATSAGNVIEIPEVTTTEPIVIDIQAGGTINPGTNDLTIQNKKDVDFDGTIIFKNASATALSLTVNLPKADVVIAGDFSWQMLTVTAAKSLTIGDGALTTTFTNNIAPTALTESMTIEGAATVGNVILPPASTKDFTLDIKGESTGTVNAGIATVNMTGYTDGTGVLHGAKIINLISNGGNVTIALPTEGEAITSNLYMVADNNNLIVKQGYINSLNVTASAAIANPKNLEVNINNPGQGLVAFQSVSGDGNAKINMTESPYVGEFNSIDKTSNFSPYYITGDVWTAQQLTAYNAKYANNALTDGATLSSSLNIRNNIDLKGIQWWGLKVTSPISINGLDVDLYNYSTPAPRTIKNFDFFKQAITKDNTGNIGTAIERGFIATASATVAVNDIKFSGVKGNFASYNGNADTKSFKKTVKNLGAVVGSSSAPVYLTNVSVEITDNFGIAAFTNVDKSKLQGTELPNIGGLIGYANGEVIITNGQVTGSSIKGYGPIGGLVGFLAANNDLTVQKNSDNVKSSSKFSSYGIAYKSGDNSDFNYVKNGAVLGSLEAATGKATINIEDNTAANWTYSFTNPGRSYIAEKVSATNVNEYDFTRDGVNLIGFYAGLQADKGYESFTIGGKTAEVVYADVLKPYAGATIENLAKWKADAANKNKLVLYYFTKK
jgi:hypothetical protein